MGSSVILPVPGQPTTGPDPHFVSGSTPALVTFDLAGLDPPSLTYIQRDDVLLIQAISAIAGEIVRVSGRILQAPVPRGGQPDTGQPSAGLPDPRNSNVIQTFTTDFIVGPVRVQNFTQLALAEGYLLGVIASGLNSLTRGQTYVRVTIVRQGASVSFARQVLLADYVWASEPATWPGGRVISLQEGPGWRHTVQQANPAAGADWTFTAAGGQRLSLISFTAQLVTSATVANRNVEVIIDDGANVVWRTSIPSSITATTTAFVSGAQSNQPTGVVTTDITVLIPPGVILQPGWRLRTNTVGLQAGDQWSAIWLDVDEFTGEGQI